MMLDVIFDKKRREEIQSDIGRGRAIKFRRRIPEADGVYAGAGAGDMNPGESVYDYRPNFVASMFRQMSNEDKIAFRKVTGKCIEAASPEEIIQFIGSEGVFGKKPQGQ